MNFKLKYILFFFIVIGVYSLVNYYIYKRAMQSLSGSGVNRTFFVSFFWVLILAFPAGKILERIWISWFSDALVWTGSLWLAVFVYLLLFVLFFDLIRLANYIIPFFPAFVTEDYEKFKLRIAVIVSAIVLVIVVAGYINAVFPRTKKMQFAIDKKAGNMKELSIVAVSDLHLSAVVGKKRVERLVRKINSLNPDIVLLVGDMLDDDIETVKQHRLLEHFRDIKAEYGVYAVPGNHEYISRAYIDWNYFASSGITLLRDSLIQIAGSFYIAGRDDRSSSGENHKKRKSLTEIMKQADTRLPVIVLDHQPVHLEEPANMGVDLQISGHTHHGQLWPFNYITRAIFEVSWGYKKKQNTHVYVSSGFGTSGPFIRTSNRPEIIFIRLGFGEKKR